MRPRYFVDPAWFGQWPELTDLVGRELSLAPGDAHHARRVLRSRVGDPCELVLEPHGVLLSAVVAAMAEEVVVRVESVLPAPRPDRAAITLVQGVPEVRKMDEVVEKGTEVGVDRFLVVRTSGSPPLQVERLRERAERWRRIAREAAKQSRQLRVPSVEVLPSLQAALERLKTESWRGLVLDPESGAPLPEVLAGLDVGVTPVRVALWVGPEGGWADTERAAFRQASSAFATLGRRVLRTETAGPVAAAVCRSALGDW